MQSLFEKYGPLTETYLPLDKTTNKPTGIGFVTFVMPEHAVKAFNELDGKVFQGRYLHILPSKAKETKEEVAGELIYMYVLWTSPSSSVKFYFLLFLDNMLMHGYEFKVQVCGTINFC